MMTTCSPSPCSCKIAAACSRFSCVSLDVSSAMMRSAAMPCPISQSRMACPSGTSSPAPCPPVVMHSTSGFSSRYACAASSRRISIRLGRVPRTLQPSTTTVSGAVGFVQIVRTICTDITAEKVSPAASRIPTADSPILPPSGSQHRCTIWANFRGNMVTNSRNRHTRMPARLPGLQIRFQIGNTKKNSSTSSGSRSR